MSDIRSLEKANLSAHPVKHGDLWRDRVVVALGILIIVGLSWAYLWTGAGTMEAMGDMLMPMSSGPWSLQHASVMLLMWSVMMAAMMLPSALPMLLFYTMLARGRLHKGGHYSLTGAFAGGYLALWVAFSLAATALQAALENASLLSPMMEATSIYFASGVLIGAGLYQWTPFKQSCLKHCRSPLEFVLTNWREGTRGAFFMGLQHGAYCLGCCWLLMLLLFVGGVMNLAWIAGLALLVLVEKLAPAGHWLSRLVGVVLVGWGVTTLYAPALTGLGLMLG